MNRVALATLVLVAGCAELDEPPEEAVEAEEAPTRSTEETIEELKSFEVEGMAAAACDEFRTFVAELEDGPTEERIGERLDKIRTTGQMADDDRVREVAHEMGDVGTEAEVDAWIADFGEACSDAGH